MDPMVSKLNQTTNKVMLENVRLHVRADLNRRRRAARSTWELWLIESEAHDTIEEVQMALRPQKGEQIATGLLRADEWA